MKLAVALASLALAVLPALADVPEWGQCGGLTYTGDKVCASGLTCVYSNEYYSQCLRTSTSATSASSTRASSSTTSTSTSASATATSVTGFVRTSGTRFTVNGAKFVPVGTNSYWVGLGGYSDTDIDKAFGDIAASGATVVRTWGFNEVTSATINNYPIYYQSWASGSPVVNTGSNGLANFDKIVAAAKTHGLRLIVALTNNWGDYGGMDVYVNTLIGAGSAHDLFYTNAAVIAAYKNYIKAFVGRYVNEPGIMAWELGNEPRCTGSTGTSTGTCDTTTITTWATNISAYIKSLDSNHLVAIGDEGFYAQPSNPSYPYQGHEGIDFDANLNISSVDFGTFHAYPEPWGQTSDPYAWGVQWINDHATSMVAANKPAIIEEFGLTTAYRTSAGYIAWYNAIVSSGLTGDLIWQAGSYLSGGSTWDDGYGVFPNSTLYRDQTNHAAALKARST